MSYSDRLEKLQSAWRKQEKIKGGGGLPPGTYQCQITSAKALEKKMGESVALCAEFKLKVLQGPMKNRSVTKVQNLESKNDEGKDVGIGFFKGDLDTLKVDIPEKLTEKSIKNALEQCVDSVVDVRVVESKNGFTNYYFSRLVDAPEEDDDQTEQETEADDSEDEPPKKKAKPVAEEPEEDEPEPPRKAKSKTTIRPIEDEDESESNDEPEDEDEPKGKAKTEGEKLFDDSE